MYVANRPRTYNKYQLNSKSTGKMKKKIKKKCVVGHSYAELKIPHLPAHVLTQNNTSWVNYPHRA